MTVLTRFFAEESHRERALRAKLQVTAGQALHPSGTSEQQLTIEGPSP